MYKIYVFSFYSFFFSLCNILPPQYSHRWRLKSSGSILMCSGPIPDFDLLLCEWRGQCTVHSGYGLSQWETSLQCNVVSHWLSPYPECSVQWWCYLLSAKWSYCPMCVSVCCICVSFCSTHHSISIYFLSLQNLQNWWRNKNNPGSKRHISH